MYYDFPPALHACMGKPRQTSCSALSCLGMHGAGVFCYAELAAKPVNCHVPGRITHAVASGTAGGRGAKLETRTDYSTHPVSINRLLGGKIGVRFRTFPLD